MCVAQSAFAALDVGLSQRIKPLECTVTTIQTGGSQALAQASSGCGTVVVPGLPVLAPGPAAGGAVPTSSGGGQSQPPHEYTQLPYLNDLPGFLSTRGVTLVAQKGSQYLFRLSQDSRVVAPRVLTVVSVSESGVVVRFAPDGGDVNLRVGEKRHLNLAYDHRVDVWITVQQANADGSVTIRVGLYAQQALSDRVQEHSLVLVLSAILVAVLTVGMHIYHRIRQPALKKEWEPHFYAM